MLNTPLPFFIFFKRVKYTYLCVNEKKNYSKINLKKVGTYSF